MKCLPLDQNQPNVEKHPRTFNFNFIIFEISCACSGYEKVNLVMSH